MKSTGIMRKFDTVGRISIPVELRHILEIKEKDTMEIFREGDKIVLKKYQPLNSQKKLDKILNRKNSLASEKNIPDSKGITKLLTELQKCFETKKI
ncbi:AbrB/MazE/SpoVT family DNA-binding domain-containing protein [Bacillus sp. SN10]|uniref:AbrB/MazE/SpoVT family DNA-binding domain-containing protein n=1 Tax=Bacillus sp. SN10 TaxID=2056493 RepID=UPI000C342015|nr:transition state regulator Abh [Bacillus sp. SN10]